MENTNIQICRGNANNSIIIDEQLELFVEEKNIQQVIDVFSSILNISGYINIDFADVLHMVKSNNIYSVNYTKIKKSDEFKLNTKEIRSKGVIISILTPQSTKNVDTIDEFITIISQSFDVDTEIICGVSFENNLDEIEAEIIELY